MFQIIKQMLMFNKDYQSKYNMEFLSDDFKNERQTRVAKPIWPYVIVP